jgi:hypothetical protein
VALVVRPQVRNKALHDTYLRQGEMKVLEFGNDGEQQQQQTAAAPADLAVVAGQAAAAAVLCALWWRGRSNRDTRHETPAAHNVSHNAAEHDTNVFVLGRLVTGPTCNHSSQYSMCCGVAHLPVLCC